MADKTHIEWTDATWNPVTGCSVVSPGCTNCYAMRLAGTRLRHIESRAGLTVKSKAGPVWNGQVRFNEQWLDQPLRWKRPRRIFVCAHGDLFHEAIPDAWLDQVFAVMALAPQHIFQVLTKRPARMREYLADAKRCGDQWCRHAGAILGNRDPGEAPGWPLPNVWLGVSVEDQARADERIPGLLATPAAVRFISAEPLLGPVTIPQVIDHGKDGIWCDPLRTPPGGINWVITGGESGPGARPMHPDWARGLRDQCILAGVPFFFKQWGEWAPANAPIDPARGDGLWLDDDGTTMTMPLGGGYDRARLNLAAMRSVGKRAAGRLLDGREWSEFPA